MAIRYASRKFIISILSVVSADVLVFLHVIDAGVWGTTVGGVVALYIAGNVGQKATAKNTPPTIGG